jgi:hypothetical protein
MAEPMTLETIAKLLEECRAILTDIRAEFAGIRADRERLRARFPREEFWRCYEEGQRNRENDPTTKMDDGG